MTGKPLFLLLALIPLACGNADRKYADAHRELDRTIERQDEIIGLKMERTDSLRREFLRAGDSFSQYAIAEQLYWEYTRFDIDSALVYAHLKERTAADSGDDDLIFDAALDLADQYRLSGEYGPALDIVNALDTVGISSGNKLAYYNVLKNLHRGLYQTGKDPVLIDYHYKKMLDYVRLIQQGTANITADNADISIKETDPDLARQIMIDNYSTGEIDSKAHLHYFLAKTYGAEGDRENEILHYAISANCDLSSQVVVSRSLIRLARLLFENGDTSRSFKYLLAAYDRAAKANNKVALEEANSFLPQVIYSYETLNRRQSGVLVAVMLLLLVFIVFLTMSVVRINRDRARNLALQDIISKENIHINEMNARLEQQITQIKENNEIKDAYLGRYMSMFSEHIDSLDRYRSRLRVVAKSYDVQEIQKVLRSDDFIEEERRTLLNEFDKTFLALFPNFVDRLNALLREDCRIGTDLKPGTMSNELRIFALIRLGISDSASIARFLRKSLSTIYNYRVKMRNNALAGRDEFEKRLMEIGNGS